MKREIHKSRIRRGCTLSPNDLERDKLERERERETRVNEQTTVVDSIALFMKDSFPRGKIGAAWQREDQDGECCLKNVNSARGYARRRAVMFVKSATLLRRRSREVHQSASRVHARARLQTNAERNSVLRILARL